MPHQDRPTAAALAVLIVLQVIMLTALYAAVPPHPPVSTPMFGMAPFIGAGLSAAVSALMMGSVNSGGGRVLSGLAMVLALISFGPQKYLDEQIALIWPAVVAGQLAAGVIFVRIARAVLQKKVSDQRGDLAQGAA
jgi:hypothetical protein